MYIVTKTSIMLTTAIDNSEGSHQNPILRVGTMSLCPYQSHIGLSSPLKLASAVVLKTGMDIHSGILETHTSKLG